MIKTALHRVTAPDRETLPVPFTKGLIENLSRQGGTRPASLIVISLTDINLRNKASTQPPPNFFLFDHVDFPAKGQIAAQKMQESSVLAYHSLF